MSEGAELKLIDVLETMNEFGRASVELVAWEFSLDPVDLWPMWRDAVAEHLLEFAEDDKAGEEIYLLTAHGREHLEVLRRRLAS
jgi:hypothetical protein